MRLPAYVPGLSCRAVEKRYGEVAYADHLDPQGGVRSFRPQSTASS